MDGFEFVRRLRKRWPGYPARTLMLSSASSLGDDVQCRELGIGRHILKPAKAQELYTAICHAVEMPRGDVEPLEDGRDGAAGMPSADHLQLKILVAEDNAVNQRVVKRVLEKAGHTVVIAGNGKQALDEFDRQRFDLILMDIQMPEMDGFEATEAIREREEWSSIRTPIIALTAHAMSGDRERCLSHGMDGYIQKPINTSEMFQAIQQTFRPGNNS
jgi:CheY-like chemotaxis protein